MGRCTSLKRFIHSPKMDLQQSGASKSAKKNKAKKEKKKAENDEAVVKPPTDPVKATPKGEPKAAAKPKATKSAGKPAAPKAAPEPAKTQEADFSLAIDDGTGGDWSEVGAFSKKKRQQQRKEQQREEVAVNAPTPSVPIVEAPIADPSKVKIKSGGKDKEEVRDVLMAQLAGNAANATAAVVANAVDTGMPASKLEQEMSERVEISVPQKVIGRVIGKGGVNMINIKAKTGITSIDTSGNVFVLTGTPESVAEAQKILQELIDKGYTGCEEERYVDVHPTQLPDIIGKEGCIIQAIKKACDVAIDIPQESKKGKGGGAGPAPRDAKVSVAVAGTREMVEKAVGILTNILHVYHDEVTHPGDIREELEVAERNYRFLIGKGGSEMRHIQNSFKVRVCIPREHSFLRNVAIVGKKDNVEKAKAYIEKILYYATVQPRGRDGRNDDYEEEEYEEDWMKQYIYKR